jgi:hypothetical protein
MEQPPSNDSTDDLLASLERELQSKREKKSPAGDTSTDEFLSSLQAEFQSQQTAKRLSPEHQPPVNRELEELERQLQRKQQGQSTSLPSQNIEVIQNQELEKQRRQNLLTRKAEQWLRNLDPHSDEGLWFEQFSGGYESRLAAAIDYLQGLGEKF